MVLARPAQRSVGPRSSAKDPRLIDDMWYHFVTDLGFMGPDKGQGGKYLLLPPVIKARSGRVTLSCGGDAQYLGRVAHLSGGRRPKPGVDLVKKFTKIYPLSQAANPPH